MQLLRKILFLIFAAIYIILCPLMIMYALGYLYKPWAESGLVRTGLIYISTAPEGAAVYLNNRRFTARTPTVLRDLLPGKYSVKLALKGYASWSETVPVEAEKATVLDSILLLPEKWPYQLVLDHGFRDIIPFADSGFFLVKASDKLLDFFVCGHSGDKGLRIVSPYSSFAEEKVISCFAPAKEASSTIVVTASPGGERYVWAGIGGGKVRVKDITSLFGSAPERIEWRRDNEKYIFAMNKGRVDRIDIADEAAYPGYLDGVRGFGVSDNSIYVLGEDNVLVKAGYDKKDKRIISDDPIFTAELASLEGVVRIFPLSENVALLLDGKGKLIANRPPYKMAESGVRGVEYCPEKERLLFWRKEAVTVVDLSGALADDEEGAPEPDRVYAGRNIEQVFWAYQGSHLIIRDGNNVSLLELETFGGARSRWILETKPASAVFYAERTGRLYYLDRTNGKLMSIDIVPPKGIMPAPLTELKEKIKMLRSASRGQ